MLLRSWEGGAWQFQDYENYDYNSMENDTLTSYLAANNVGAIVRFVRQEGRPHSYMVFMSSSEVTYEDSSGLPPGRLKQLELELLTSGQCKIIYQNPDVDILQFVDNTKGGQP
jgi:hypothetical protein